MNNEETEDEYIPSELLEAADEAIGNTLPDKSKAIYEKTYAEFTEWMAEKKTNSYNQIVLLAYFNELSKRVGPSTLWSKYSMIRTMLLIKKNVNIKEYENLKAFIKKQNIGATAKKAEVFKTSEVNKFLNEAPNSTHLAHKVALVLGMEGACRRDELYKLTMNCVRRENSVFIINLKDTKTHIPRTFTIEGSHSEFINEYIQLRPSNDDVQKFFLTYRNGKCTRQVMGKNKIGSIPREIANWLKLPDADKYTGHSFRRTSATILSDAGASMTELKRHGGWRSAQVAEGYIKDSIENKRKSSKRVADAIQNDFDKEVPTKKLKTDVDQNVALLNVEQKSITLNIRFN